MRSTELDVDRVAFYGNGIIPDSIQRGDVLTTSFSLQRQATVRQILIRWQYGTSSASRLETAAPSVWNIDDSMGELAHLTETAERP